MLVLRNEIRDISWTARNMIVSALYQVYGDPFQTVPALVGTFACGQFWATVGSFSALVCLALLVPVAAKPLSMSFSFSPCVRLSFRVYVGKEGGGREVETCGTFRYRKSNQVALRPHVVYTVPTIFYALQSDTYRCSAGVAQDSLLPSPPTLILRCMP